MSVIFENPLKALSALVCVLVVVGLLKRTKRRTHVTMMVSAFTIDVGIVLYLEITRHVVESAASREMSGLLIFHIFLSVVVLCLYGLQIYTGVTKKLKNAPCPLHKKSAVLFVITRLGNLITSIIVMQP